MPSPAASILWIALSVLAAAHASPVITTVALGDNPQGVASDSAGNVYFADTNSHSVRKVDLLGNLTTIAGNGTAGFAGDGGSATLSQLSSPNGVAVDTAGNVYIADTGNHRIRHIATNGDITTIAGTGIGGSTGDGGAAIFARVRPTAIAVHTDGTLYFTETITHRVRRIAGGIVATVAGTGVAGFSGDGGPGVAAQVSGPSGIAVDASGRVLVADFGNGRIRRIDALGVITTFAGNPTGTQGDGSLATATRIDTPRGVAVAGSGVVYVSHFNWIRYIGTDGIVDTLAGDALGGFEGDGGPAGDALMAGPTAMALDAAGSLLVADSQNNRIRKITDPNPPPTAPLAPVVSTATSGDQQVSVAFAAAGDGGSPITHFIATCGTESAQGAASPIVVSNLTNGTIYLCSVVAVNAVGPSAASNAVNGWPMGQPVVTVSGPASALVETNVTFTASISGTNLDGGGIAFLVAGIPVAGCDGLAIVAGQAQCTLVFSTAGDRSITAAFSGNAYNATTYSSVFIHTVTTPSSYLQEVTRSGTGGGTVTSLPAGIDCGSDCSESFVPSTVVALTATPDAISTFTQWQGPACVEGQTSATCTLPPLTGNRQQVAVFTVKMFTATVGRNAAAGQISMNPGDCTPDSCSYSIAGGSVVSFSALANPGAMFVGWSGVTCNQGPQVSPCTFTLTGDVSAIATFGHNLQLAKAGTGAGSVTSTPAGIACNDACTFAESIFMPGTNVTLTAVPGANSTFAGWSGACSGTGQCTVQMSEHLAVVATFTPTPRTLAVSLSGNGSGSVVSISSPAIDCPATCSADLEHGTVVTLGATPQEGSVFTGWIGGGCTGTGICAVTMDQARSVTANFTAVRNLAVTLLSGGGSIVSSGSPVIDCPALCAADLPLGSAVTLVAIPESGFSLSAWSGACTGTGSCVLTMDQAHAVTATFVLTPLLTVSTAGNGSGSVTSVGSSSIACPGTCSAAFQLGTVITLAATPQAGSTFAGWSGACTGTGTCVVTMDQARSVSATFTPTRTLTVARAGNGIGSVASIGSSAIACPATCAAEFPHGTEVTLAATSQGASTFVGWSGACSGNGTCVLAMDQARTVTATFTATHTLTITRAGNGSGSVASIGSSAIDCPATCSADIAQGTVITLAATPQAGSAFTGWNGGGCAGSGTCVVTMDQAKTVTATFAGPRTLAVSRAGSGSGSVISIGSPAINCPATCSAEIPYGTVMTLEATPHAGSTFAGWSGGGCSGTGTCVLAMDQARTVTATFDPPATQSSADLALAQSATPETGSVGKDVILAFTVTNNGPATATGVVLSQPTPAGTTSIWSQPGCAASAGTVTCSRDALAPGASATFRIVVRPMIAGSMTSSASVNAAEPDPSSMGNASSITIAVNTTPSGVPATRYRLYSPVTLEHHFTTDLNEYTVLGGNGAWVQEGTVGKVLDNPGSYGGVEAVPYYRLYDNGTRWHHWTTDANEYYTLGYVFSGWNMEGVDGYILPTQAPGTIQLYRLNYPALGSLHHWTIDANEYTTLITPAYGWVGEGGSGFVIP